MTGINHALTGIVIATAVRQPVLAPIFAFLSHFVIDMLPHFGGIAWYDKWGKSLIIMTIFDILISTFFVILGMILFPDIALIILVSAFAAVLPDLFWIFHYKFKANHWYFDFHQKIQQYERPWGAFVEIAFCILLLTFLLTR